MYFIQCNIVDVLVLECCFVNDGDAWVVSLNYVLFSQLHLALLRCSLSSYAIAAKSILVMQPDVNIVSYTIGCEARTRRLPYCDMIGLHMQTFLGAEV